MSTSTVVLLGGMPGAGKSTAVRRLAAVRPDVSALDPEQVHRAVAARVPPRLPYRAYRAAVHLGHTLRVVRALLTTGPASGLVVHDPGTGLLRRRLYRALASARGWRVVLLYVDVDLVTAAEGQRRRGRVLRAAAFDRHWRRWQRTRDRLCPGDAPLLVSRDETVDALLAALPGPAGQNQRRSSLTSPPSSNRSVTASAAA